MHQFMIEIRACPWLVLVIDLAFFVTGIISFIKLIHCTKERNPPRTLIVVLLALCVIAWLLFVLLSLALGMALLI